MRLPNTRLLTPFRRADAGNNESFNDEDPNMTPRRSSFAPIPPRPTYLANSHNRSGSSTQSTVSVGTGQRLQKHLEAGKPLYIGFDPSQPPESSNSNMVDTGGGGNGEGGGRERFEERWKKPKQKRWPRFFTCGVPLDQSVKFILTAGLWVSSLSLLSGVNIFIDEPFPVPGQPFPTLLALFEIIWGVFFGASCLFGMLTMWGKWRRSPTVALLFTINWIFTTCLILVVAVLWFYFFAASRTVLIQACKNKTVSKGNPWDLNLPQSAAPEDRINACLKAVKTKNLGDLYWGIAHTFLVYCGILTVAWGRSYRHRLLEIREWEEVQSGMSAGNSPVGGKLYKSEKLGLVIGTAPLGKNQSPPASAVSKSPSQESYTSDPALYYEDVESPISPVTPRTPVAGGLAPRGAHSGRRGSTMIRGGSLLGPAGGVGSSRRTSAASAATMSVYSVNIAEKPLPRYPEPPPDMLEPAGLELVDHRGSYAGSTSTIARVL